MHRIPGYSAVSIEIPSVDNGSPWGDMPNLALNKRAEASSTALMTQSGYYSSNQYQPHYAIDGDDNTRWAPGIFSEQREWYSINLGQMRRFNRVRLDWEYPANRYDIEVSNDGKAWRKAADQSAAQTLRFRETSG